MATQTITDSVAQNFKAEGFLASGTAKHLVLAYSGGADSSVLLSVMGELMKTYAVKITAAFYHHAWHGHIIQELSILHQNCKRAGIPLVILQAKSFGEKNETAARKNRYDNLIDLVESLNADAIVTAHHADDQVETILFRVLRGTGTDGLVGIQKKLILKSPAGREIPVFRPLLDTPKASINKYCESQNLCYYDDPSNKDNVFERNYIRNQLFPQVESRFPQAKNALFRLGLIATSDVKIIQESIEPLWQRVYQKDETGGFMDGLLFSALGVNYQRRLLKRFFELHQLQSDFSTLASTVSFLNGTGRKFSESALKSVESLEHSSETKPLTENKPENENKSEKRFISLYRDKIRIVSKQPSIPASVSESVLPGLPVILSTDKSHTLPLEALDIALQITPWSQDPSVGLSVIRQKDIQQVLVDLSSVIDKPLVFRTRQDGDRFQPHGMPNSMRLKKFLMNRNVPRFERAKLPFLATGNRVLWLPGFGIDAVLLVDPGKLPTHQLLLAPLNPELEIPEVFSRLKILTYKTNKSVAGFKAQSNEMLLINAPVLNDESDHNIEEIETIDTLDADENTQFQSDTVGKISRKFEEGDLISEENLFDFDAGNSEIRLDVSEDFQDGMS
ncbi:MAG: tRNA lysidine(34) synthetase TilS [Cyanobacteria bacterium P01_H01_bin.74]